MLADLLARTTDIARTLVRSNAPRVDADACWPADNIRALQHAGLGGLVVPVEAGGHGEGLSAVVQVCEILGRECASTALSFGMHLVGSAVLAAKPTPSQRSRYVEPIARGEHLTTLALSEPGTGSHFYIPEARVVPDGDDRLQITGTKSFVTNGAHADSYVISVAAASSAHAPGEFSCVVVRGDTDRLRWGSPWAGWGMRGNSSRTLTLDGVRVPREDLLGREGDEIWYMFRVVTPYFLCAMSGTYLGLADAALADAREHLLGRVHTHTASPLAHQPVLQHRFGTLWAQIQRTRALLYDAARMAEVGDPLALPALCSAKAEVADTAERVIADVMTLLGGRGYGESARVQRLYRDARAAHVMAPTTEQLRLWTGRALLDLPLLGD